jgi:hypothetical protein
MLKADGFSERELGYGNFPVELRQSPYSARTIKTDMLLSLRLGTWAMDRRGVEELREELARLMRGHIESLNQQTFGGLDDELLRQQEERLKKIREVSAEFLAALKRDRV